MNEFQRKTAEQMALISTLVIDINKRANGLDIRMSFYGQVNKLDIDFNHLRNQEGRFKAGDKEFWNTFSLSTYIEKKQQELPYKGCCTLEQMTHVLQQIRQALIEGRSHDEHYPATNIEHIATTRVDERHGTDGAFFNEPAEFCHGSFERTGEQQAGSALPAP